MTTCVNLELSEKKKLTCHASCLSAGMTSSNSFVCLVWVFLGRWITDKVEGTTADKLY